MTKKINLTGIKKNVWIRARLKLEKMVSGDKLIISADADASEEIINGLQKDEYVFEHIPAANEQSAEQFHVTARQKIVFLT